MPRLDDVERGNTVRITREGEIRRDVFGSWDDCDPGLYIGQDMIETIFSQLASKNVKLTIEFNE